jgi:hypothetical protein
VSCTSGRLAMSLISWITSSCWGVSGGTVGLRCGARRM